MSKYDIRKIFTDMELDLIASMKRNLAAHELEEEKHGFKWKQWQQRKLASLKAFRERNRKIVQDQGPDIDREVKRTIRSAFRQGIKLVADAAKRLWYRFGVGKRRDTPRPVPTPRKPKGQKIPREEMPTAPESNDAHFFGMNEKRLGALTDASQRELRAAQHAMLRKMDDVYRQTIFKAQVYHNSGAASLGQAIDMATKDFLDRGIDVITYSDGRKVNVASYAEMALRTASQRAVFEGQGAERQAIGITTVVVSAHNNCSDLCLPWQGKVYIDDVYSGGKSSDGDYPLLSKAMAGGLFHPNCRHNMGIFIPGASRMPRAVDDARASANYDAEQKQRYMERQIRKYKRREAGFVDPVNQAAAKEKVKEWQGKLKVHLVDNDHLRGDSRRERTKLSPVTEKQLQGQKVASDSKQFTRYKLIYGEKLGAESLEEFQHIKYNDGNDWKHLKANRQQALNALDYRDEMFGQFGNKEVRSWYVTHDRDIGNLIDKNKSIKEQAIQGFELRNKYRSDARKMMRDREEAERLERQLPNESFESLVKKKVIKYGMTEDEAYADIVRSAQAPNDEVNRKFGID